MAATMLLTTAIGWNAQAAEHTLKSIMQDLGEQMGQLVKGIMADNMETVSQAAVAIADHPKPGLGERLVLLGRIGSDVTTFRQKDVEVHEAAIFIKQAAEVGDRDALVSGFHRLTKACLACHMQFRDVIVDADRTDENRP